MFRFNNFAKAEIATSISDTDVVISVATGLGARFVNLPCVSVVWNASDYADPSDDPGHEVVIVTGVSGDVLDVLRGAEGTTAVSHDVSGKVYKIANVFSAEVASIMYPSFLTIDPSDVSVVGYNSDTSFSVTVLTIRYARVGQLLVLYFFIQGSLTAPSSEYGVMINLPSYVGGFGAIGSAQISYSRSGVNDESTPTSWTTRYVTDTCFVYGSSSITVELGYHGESDPWPNISGDAQFFGQLLIPLA